MKRKIALALVLCMFITLTSGCHLIKKPETSKQTQPPQAEQTPAAETPQQPETDEKSDTSGSENTPVPTVIPAPEPTNGDHAASMFDETYWIWGIDITVGTIFYVLMHNDGTLSYINIKDHGEDAVVTLRYTYENGKLWIEDTPYRGMALTYHLTADGVFESDEVLPSQDTDFRVTLRPDPEMTYLDHM